MANHVVNEIIFRNADWKARQNIAGKVLNDEREVDFNILVPMPLNIWQGPVGQEENAAFSGRNWRKWSVENWGTKWNAIAVKSVPAVTVTGDTLTIVFKTAWSPPRPWACALFNATLRPFEHNWLEESERNAHTERYLFDADDEKSPLWGMILSDTETYRRLHVFLRGSEPESGREGNAE
jgi:hypothetical protein